MDEYVGKDPAKLAVNSHDALALLGEESSRLGREIRRPGLTILAVAAIQPDAPPRRRRPYPTFNVSTSERMRHAVSYAIVAASAGPGWRSSTSWLHPPQALAEQPSATTREETAPPLSDEDHHAAWRVTATTPRHDGQSWNRETVAQVHAAMGAHLSPADRDELFSFALPVLNAAHAEIARGLEVSPENTEALLMEEWSDEWDAKTLAAEAAWSKLPKAEQREWTRSGLRYHPNVWRFLADVGSPIKRAGAKS